MIFLKASHTPLVKTQASTAGFAHKNCFVRLRIRAAECACSTRTFDRHVFDITVTHKIKMHKILNLP